MLCRSRQVALVVPLGLLGSWNSPVQAMEPDCPEGRLSESGGQCLDVQHGMPSPSPLQGIRFQVQPEPGFPEMEWTAGAVLPVGQNTQLIAGYRAEAIAPSLTSASHRWKTQAVLGAHHQWELRPGVQLAVTYEHLLGKLGSSENAAHQAKADLAYQFHPNWDTKMRVEQRAGRQTSRLRINSRVTGQLSPSLTAKVQAHHYRQSSKTPDSHVQLGLAYASPRKNPAGDTWLKADLNYEYRQKRESAHLLRAGATYRPNWRWTLRGNLGLRQRPSDSAALAQMRLRHYLPSRFDVGGDVRLVQNIGRDRNSGVGATMELGYHVNSKVRLSTGYALGKTKDRHFRDSQSPGSYFGVEFK